MNFKKIILSFFFLWTTACVQTPPPLPLHAVFLQDNAPVALFPVSVFQSLPERTIKQTISGHAPQGNFDGEGVLKFSKEGLVVAALYPAGRLFTVSYQDETGIEWTPGLLKADKINPAYILMDVGLIYLPVAVLQAYLPAPYRVVQNATERQILYQETPLIKITYSKPDVIVYQNIKRGYRYTLRERS